MGKGKSFFDSLVQSAMAYSAAQASKGSNGRPDPYMASGMAFGVHGDLSDSDLAELGAMLGAQGAFDDNND